MARIRSIKPEFPQSESVGRVSREARLLFIQLWTFVDDTGRARASSRMLASLLYPYDTDAGDLIDGWMGELVKERMVRLYDVDGTKYLDIPKWLEHQKIDHPSKSRFPEFREGLARAREGLAPDLGPRIGPRIGPRTKEVSPSPAPQLKLVPEEPKSPRASPLASEFKVFYGLYPRKEAPRAAEKAFIAARKRGQLEDIMAGLKRAIPKWDDPQYIPHPASWLNKDRWLDQPAIERKNSNIF